MMQTVCQVRIAVCDDRQAERVQITTLVGRILREAEIPYHIAEYESGRKLLADIHNGAQYQILLLDVMLDEQIDQINGIELAGLLRRQEYKSSIIFISSNREMALNGYEVEAARFLAKPLNVEKLKEAVLYCCSHIQKQKEILLPTEHGNHRISIADIRYVEAFDRGCRVVLNGETVDSRLKFGEMEALLPGPDFLLCHRAYVVNLACVKYIRHYEFELKDGSLVPISKGRYQEVHRQFVDYITN